MRKLIILPLILFIVSCGESGRLSKIPTKPRSEQQTILSLELLSYEFVGDCQAEKSHRLVGFPGLIEFDDQQERYIVHQLELALFWEEQTYHLADTFYYSDDEDYAPEIQLYSGSFVIQNKNKIILEQIGQVTLEVVGQKVRPKLNRSGQFLSGVLSPSSFGQVIRKSQSVLFPDC